MSQPAPAGGALPAHPLLDETLRTVARGEAPGAALKRLFVEALARMIHEAMRAESGDPVFQAMVLRHRTAQVREYASLSAHAGRVVIDARVDRPAWRDSRILRIPNGYSYN